MLNFNHFSLSHIGNVRQTNEDCFGDRALANGGHVFVVCDGMGGHAGGSIASEMATKAILDYFPHNSLVRPSELIYNALVHANTLLFEYSLNDVSLKGMGTTAVVLLIFDNLIYLGSIGDSRIYCFSDNQLCRLTKDHSFVQELIDLGQLDEEDADSHPMKNRITKALGIHSAINPTILEVGIQVKAGDCIMLCSDGLNGMINDSNIESILQTSNSIQSSVNDLIQKALELGGKDNVTLTLVEIIGSPYTESTFIPYIPPPKSTRKDDTKSFMEEVRTSKPNFLQNTNWLRYLVVFIIIIKIIYLFLTMK